MPTKKWTIGGIDYEVVNATDMSVDGGDEKLGDIMSFTDELATKVENDRIKGEENAEAAVRLDGDNFFTGGGSPRDYGCVTARKDGQVVGVLSFKWGGGSGLLDRGVVAREERKRAVEDGKPISEDLMRLALAELVAEHECDLVMAEPVSERGRKYTESNGFNLKGNKQVGRHGKEFYYLDDKIIEKMKEFLAQKNEGNKATEETILELRNEFDHYLSDVRSERQGELGIKNK